MGHHTGGSGGRTGELFCFSFHSNSGDFRSVIRHSVTVEHPWMDFASGRADIGRTTWLGVNTTSVPSMWWIWSSSGLSSFFLIFFLTYCRQFAAGDRLRGQYQGLSADPNSLANLDQDLPNNMIHQVS